ncbi:MAG: acetate--CoA ligase family protein [Planctomycetes bacterium]|nr:acetate--CoA ligase family protein [Planctomycetota bacterium]
MDRAAVAGILAAVRADGREVLREAEGLALLGALGLRVPAHVGFRRPAEVDDASLASLPGPRVVVKVLSSSIAHKSDVGGVRVVDRAPAAVAAAMAAMEARIPPADVEGFSVHEFVPHSAEPGGEFLVGLRWTPDAGSVVTVGPGGIHAELLARALRPGRGIAVLSPSLADPARVGAALSGLAVTELATRPLRGRPARLDPAELRRTVAAFLELAAAFGPGIAEGEVNPFVIGPDGGLVALDVLFRLRDPADGLPAAPRPLHRLRSMLAPRTVAVAGVSERRNPGRIIVENLLADGFDPGSLWILKPGGMSLGGCRTADGVASLPGRVDLLVLALDAARSAEALEEAVALERAESVVLLAGGLEEKSGGAAVADRMRAALARSRATAWGGPLLCGGNCLGFRSRPGRCDTLFIPRHKLPSPRGGPGRWALLSQSGAFGVARASRLAPLDPRHLVTLGNQMDLTVGDCLAGLSEDPDLDLFAVYVEGFRPLDGLRFLEAARAVAESGRTVVLYRAGRTEAGARASASHTASLAGDYAVLGALAAAAGVVLAESLEEFEDLVLLFALLGGGPLPGLRLAAISNAGFECVAMADNLGPFTLPPFGPGTEERLRGILARHRVDGVVDVHNPLDLTPITPDAGFAEAVEAVLADGGTDAAVVGCVPLSGALQTLAPGPGHGEDVGREEGLVRRLGRLRRGSAKPWIAVVDAGEPFDPMARLLAAEGIPTFRSADRALRAFGRYAAVRAGRTGP